MRTGIIRVCILACPGRAVALLQNLLFSCRLRLYRVENVLLTSIIINTRCYNNCRVRRVSRNVFSFNVLSTARPLRFAQKLRVPSVFIAPPLLYSSLSLSPRVRYYYNPNE